MFTLYRIAKRSVAETVSGKASVHTRTATFGTISVPEQGGLLCSIFKRCNKFNAVPDQFLRRSVLLFGTV